MFLLSALPILMQCGDRQKYQRQVLFFFLIVIFLCDYFLFRMSVDLLTE